MRAAFRDDGREPREIPDVRRFRAHGVRDLRKFEKAWLRRRGKRITGDVGSEGFQPQTEPAPFETGMPGDEHLAALPKRTIKHAGSEPARELAGICELPRKK